jgi:hypothetical protein
LMHGQHCIIEAGISHSMRVVNIIE